MAYNITGSKYGVLTVSAIGTTTVTIGTASFVSGDFSKQRLVALFSSANVFKGMAWVRRFVSTTSLELQLAFTDPATNLVVTQAVGDKILVSKDFSESVSAGLLTVSNNQVTMTDPDVGFGTDNDEMSVCFYDENKSIFVTTRFFFRGGVTVFGKLDDYTSRATTSACDFYFGPSASNQGSFRCTSYSAHACMYGGSFSGGSGYVVYIGGVISNAGGGQGGKTLVLMGAQNKFDFSGPGHGGSFGPNALRHLLIDCKSYTDGFYAILVKWGNGQVIGGDLKILNFSSAPISFYGSDIAGTYTISAPPSSRIIIRDAGNQVQLTRSNFAVALLFNFTNLITTTFGAAVSVSPNAPANPNGVNTMYFSDSYTNLLAGSAGVITLDSDDSVVDSTLDSGDVWSPVLLRRRYTGKTETFVRGPWHYGIKKYGAAAIGGAITPSTFDLGTAGQADNVAFGGLVNQLADDGVTLSEAAALALTSIDTLSDAYDAATAWAVLTVDNFKYPSLDQYPVIRDGVVITYAGINVVIDPAAASAFALNTGTNTLTIKSSTLNPSVKFTTLEAASIAVSAGSTVNVDLVGPVTNAGMLMGTVTGNVANTGTINNTTVTGNVTQDLPTDMTGTVITGNLTYNTDTPITVTFTNCTIGGTVSNSGSGLVTVILAGSSAIDTVGANVAVLLQRQAAVTGIVAGSRLRVVNVTTATVVVNEIVAGTSYSATYYEGVEYTEADVIRVTLEYCVGTVAKQTFSVGAVAGASGWSALADQVDDEIYNGFAVDGSTVTTFAADYVNNQIDLTIGENFSIAEMYSWYVYNKSTELGVSFSGVITAEDQANFRINTSVVSVYLDNATTTNVYQLDNRRIYRSDGAYPVKVPTSGGGGIDVVWRNTILIAETGVSGLTPEESTKLSTLVNGPTLAQIEASEVLAKEATVATRLAASSYTAPANADIAAIKAKTDVLVNGPTLVQIEGSTVLAKEATVSTRASQVSVNDLGAPAQAVALTALGSATQAEHDATQAAIAALPTPLTSAEAQAAAAAALVAYDGVVPADLAGLATSAQVNAIPTNPLLTTDARIGNLDVAISSRLASADYVAPDNAKISEIKEIVEAQNDTLLKANQDIINRGVQQSSLLIPHSQNVTT